MLCEKREKRGQARRLPPLLSIFTCQTAKRITRSTFSFSLALRLAMRLAVDVAAVPVCREIASALLAWRLVFLSPPLPSLLVLSQALLRQPQHS
jgi:hypothetical protein